MDGWTGGWLDGWMDGWTDGWLDGWNWGFDPERVLRVGVWSHAVGMVGSRIRVVGIGSEGSG